MAKLGYFSAARFWQSARREPHISWRWLFGLGMGLFACGSTGAEPTSVTAGEATQLSVDDLAPGEATLRFRYSPTEGSDPVELTANVPDPFIAFDVNGLVCPPGWGLALRDIEEPTIDKPIAVFTWFLDSNVETPELVAGESEIFTVIVDLRTIEHGGRSTPPNAPRMKITESDGVTATGRFDSRVGVSTAPYVEEPEPSGEHFEILEAVFRDISVNRPIASAIDCDAPPTQNDCRALFEGGCYPSVEKACAAAGCPDNCNTADSLPSLVECG